MPGRVLPTFLASEVRSHNSEKSCWVTIGSSVYDVTSFLDDHPGGGELILDYGGKEVGDILKDEISHFHSDSAYEILDDHRIGFTATEKIIDVATETDTPENIIPLPPNEAGRSELRKRNVSDGILPKEVYAATGMASAEDLSVETDFVSDFQRHKFIDLNRPMFLQVWNGGFTKAFYLEQIHRPRHYKGGQSAPLFGNFLEPLSKTPWWVVPLVWLPWVGYGTMLAFQNHHNPWHVAAYSLGGIGIWTLVEYVLHRGLFHVDHYLPDNRVGITAHFLLHGIHHYLPMDRLRLVMPPTLFVVLAAPFWKLAHAIFFYNWYAAVAVYCGGIFGYICYDLTHYFLHHKNLPLHYRELKRYHLQHHFADYENGFGVTSRFWDRIFGTELPPPPAPMAMKTT